LLQGRNKRSRYLRARESWLKYRPCFSYRLLAAKNGAAARMAKVERATALALVDLGQRKFLVPLPK